MSDFEFAIRQDERRALLECRRIARIKRNQVKHINTLRKVKNVIQLILAVFMSVLTVFVCDMSKDYAPAFVIIPCAAMLLPRRRRRVG